MQVAAGMRRSKHTVVPARVWGPAGRLGQCSECHLVLLLPYGESVWLDGDRRSRCETHTPRSAHGAS
jgi:hypothetical protein